MPPKKRKPQPKNGYYFLMLDIKKEEEERGKFYSMAEVADLAKPVWESMSPDKKEYYTKMADDYKKRNNGEKFNSLGMSISEVEKQHYEQERKKRIMAEIISDTVNHLDRNSTLRTKTFHLIHVNYYCETENKQFIPAEIALAEFCLLEGVTKVHHTFVNPGELPLGYRYTATVHCDNTHKTPLGYEKGERDLNKIINSIKRFIKPGGFTGELPPLYTMPHNINTNTSDVAVRNILDKLCENTGEDPEIFRVYPLAKLFYDLRNACSEDEKAFPAQTLAESELERDVFNYTRGIACKLHEDEDVVQFCSLSMVRRWVYLICDHCCKDLNIKLIPGQHCPVKADINQQYKNYQSDALSNSGPERAWSQIPSKASSFGSNASSARNQTFEEDYPHLRMPNRSVLRPEYDGRSADSRTTSVTDVQSDRGSVSAEDGAAGHSYCDDSDDSQATTDSMWLRKTGKSSAMPAPPPVDDDNYPSIGRGAGGRGNAGGWRSGGTRGSRGKGRGIWQSFDNINLNN